MKKSLFFGLALVSTLGLSAQVKKALPVLSDLKPVTLNTVSLDKPVRAMSVDVLQNLKEKTLVGQNVASVKPLFKFGKATAAEKNELKKVASVDELLNGTLYAQGITAAMQQEVSWKVQVKPDENVTGKYWFTALTGYSGESIKDVYGTVDGTTLTIPAQEMGTYTSQEMVLQWKLMGVELSGEELVTKDVITATIDLEEETITFDGYFAIIISNASDLGLTTDLWDAYLGVYLLSENALPLTAIYYQPLGALFYGLTAPTGYVLSDLNAIAAPGVTWTWTNLTGNPAATYEWTYDKLEFDKTTGEPSVVASEKVETEHLQMEGVQEGDTYTFPVLNASLGDKEGSFTYGTIDAGEKNDLFVKDETNLVYIQAGGTTVYIPDANDPTNPEKYEYVHMTNFNPDAGLVIYTNGSGYLFGTYSDGEQSLEALYSLYDAPLQPLSFMGVNVLGTDPGSLPLTMAIQAYSIDETGRIVWGDTIAFSDTYTYDGLRVQFTDFEAEDEDGFTSVVEEVQVEPTQGFALELGGFNQEGADFAVRSEYAERPDGENRSYFRMKNADGTIDSGLYSWTGATYTMYMELAYAIYGEDPTTGIAPVESSNTTKLFSTADAFNFTYTDDFTSVDVYNVNGQKVSSYALPQAGTFSIAKAGLADGVYMFRMNGKTTEVLRAVK